MLRELAAKLVVTPLRNPFFLKTRLPHAPFSFRSGGLELKGYRFPASPGVAPRGLAVFLHGHGDNRHQGFVPAEELTRRGYEVIAYDGRAHGQSQGRFCTFGVCERDDLSRALDAAKADRALVVGASLGAAVALQAAAVDPRVKGVIGHAPFVDLRRAVYDRSFFLSEATRLRAIADAEVLAGFRADDASPLRLAPKVTVPVLLVHGKWDRQTPHWHSEQIIAALGGPKTLISVPYAGHWHLLGLRGLWTQIETWLAEHHL